MGFFKGKKSHFEELQEAVKKKAVLDINYRLSSDSPKKMKGIEDSNINQAVDAFLTSAFKIEKAKLERVLEKLNKEQMKAVKKDLTEGVSLKVREEGKFCHFIGLSYNPQVLASGAANKQAGG